MEISPRLRRLASGLVLGGLMQVSLAQADGLAIRFGYLQWQPDRGPALAQLVPEPADAGLQGARLAIADNLSTGRFLGQHHELESVIAESEEALLEALEAMLDDDISLVVMNAPARTLRQAAALGGDRVLLFNAGARDVSLRLDACSPYLLHTLPSHAMLTDALAQWLNWRRWRSVLLISGQAEGDQAWADAFRRSADKFALKIVADKAYIYGPPRGTVLTSTGPRVWLSRPGAAWTERMQRGKRCSESGRVLHRVGTGRVVHPAPIDCLDEKQAVARKIRKRARQPQVRIADDCFLQNPISVVIALGLILLLMQP